MTELERTQEARHAGDSPPTQLAKDVVPVGIGDAFRTLGRELRGTVLAYLRMIEWQKDVSWKQVTLASIDRLSFACVGIAVAVTRAFRRDTRSQVGKPGADDERSRS